MEPCNFEWIDRSGEAHCCYLDAGHGGYHNCGDCGEETPA